MKKILITGANSYIGTSFQKFIEPHRHEYEIDIVDLIDDNWRQHDFSIYDAIFHVAAIVHQKETKENRQLYYDVNRDLTLQIAQKAKEDGVRQFVFLSTMSVYGKRIGIITKNTPALPKTHYGRSKLEAEIQLHKIENEHFFASIVRAPMVYGKGCKGNFQSVCKLVKKFPFFPKIKNQRSLIYIDNLSSFVKMIIDEQLPGTFMPQDRSFTETSEMAKTIASTMGKSLHMSAILGFLVAVLMPVVPMLQKAFGNLVYENTEDFDFSYCLLDTHECYRKSV